MDPDGEAVSYDEFLALARDEGLIALDLQVVQAPGEANGHGAIVQATARTAQGSFAAVGEASPRSAPAAWHPFLTTLAELRAKARALRDLTGLEHAVREELATPYLKAPGAEGELTSPTWRQPPLNGAGARVAAATPARDSAASVAAPRPSVRPAPPAVEDDAEEAPPDDAGAPSYPAAERASPPPVVEADDEPDNGFEAIGRDMEAKLLKMAMSIASLEGGDISEDEARQKLDGFFMRAFKHPLSRATRMEGQRVVQRLSSDLARLRTVPSEEKD